MARFILCLITLLIFTTSCGEFEEINDVIDDAIDDVEGSPPELETLSPVIIEKYIPDNCSNPPKNISQFDGWKCISSSTRGGRVVCLLPYQFTWKPWQDFTDHHGVTMKCNAEDAHFNKVKLVLKDGTKINMAWDKCQNWVGTAEGKVGRQHFRAPELWKNIKNKVKTIEMTYNGSKTCLNF